MAIIDKFRLDGKIALVNGGSRGIGEAVALGLAEQGAHVIVASRKVVDCEVVAQGIRDQGYQATAMQCHTGKTDDIDELITAISKQFGHFDILVNNAAISYFGSLEKTPMEVFDKIVEVNYRGLFYMCKQAITMMKANGGGAIVNVASICGIRPESHSGAYSSTKAALINMTKTVALECGRDNIRINALCPGLVRTQLTAAVFKDEEALNKTMQKWPLPRAAMPEEMVGAVLYMLSDASSYMTGQTMVVDGGITLQGVVWL